MSKKRLIAVVLFDRFELLDVFGPLEMFGMLSEQFEIKLLSLDKEVERSDQGPRSVIDALMADVGEVDIVMVPGGEGVRFEINNPDLLAAIRSLAASAEYVISICTGSALLAAAGLLEGQKATSNKQVFDWVSTQGKNVTWQREARWVEDGKFFTASGVSAGMDMALALIAHLHGEAAASEAAKLAEYEWQRDASYDPFAALWPDQQGDNQ